MLLYIFSIIFIPFTELVVFMQINYYYYYCYMLLNVYGLFLHFLAVSVTVLYLTPMPE